MVKNIKQQILTGILIVLMGFLVPLWVASAFSAEPTTRTHKIEIAEIVYEALIPIEVPEMDAQFLNSRFLGGNVWWLRYCDGILPNHDHMDLIFHWNGGVQFIALVWVHTWEQKADHWVYEEKVPVPADIDAVLAVIEKHKMQGLI